MDIESIVFGIVGLVAGYYVYRYVTTARRAT